MPRLSCAEESALRERTSVSDSIVLNEQHQWSKVTATATVVKHTFRLAPIDCVDHRRLPCIKLTTRCLIPNMLQLVAVQNAAFIFMGST